jgi:hypothetical protein
MGRGQRFTFLAIAAVIAVVAVVLLADSSEDPGDEASTNPTPTATTDPQATASPQEAEPRETATATPSPEPTPPPPPLLESGKVRELEFTQGERIRFRVRSEVDEEIHVHGYDEYRDIPAGRTVTVAFPAELTGIFEIEFHNSGEEIASLKVEPG